MSGNGHTIELNKYIKYRSLFSFKRVAPGKGGGGSPSPILHFLWAAKIFHDKSYKQKNKYEHGVGPWSPLLCGHVNKQIENKEINSETEVIGILFVFEAVF